MKKIAIITGATGGLGQEFIKILSTYNLDEIYALGRNKDKLLMLKEKYNVIPYEIDLSSRKEIENFVNSLKDVQIEYLINNAGYAKFCAYNDLSCEESINMIDVNVVAVVEMCLKCIPFMKKESHIINIASQASFQPLPYMNIYSATKAFVRNYTRALNVELKEKGIIATAVCPGWIETGLYERGDVHAKKAPTRFFHKAKPYNVAKKALKDCYKDISVYSFYVKFCHLMSKILPQKMMMKIWLKQQKIK